MSQLGHLRTKIDHSGHFRLSTKSGSAADIAALRICARSGHQSAETFGGPAERKGRLSGRWTWFTDRRRRRW
jgi:hypothetical protein